MLTLLTNFACMLLCAAVLFQSGRLLRSLSAMRDGGLTEMVQSLEHATAQARAVLFDMKSVLGTDCAENARLIDEAKALRDELGVMIGVGDSVAGRIADAASSAHSPQLPVEEAA